MDGSRVGDGREGKLGKLGREAINREEEKEKLLFVEGVEIEVIRECEEKAWKESVKDVKCYFAVRRIVLHRQGT